MKISTLKAVCSRNFPGQVSLRGPKGKGHQDSPQQHITEAGFKDGDDVVLLSKEELLTLVTLASGVLHIARAFNPDLLCMDENALIDDLSTKLSELEEVL